MNPSAFPATPRTDYRRAVYWGFGGFSASVTTFLFIWGVRDGFVPFPLPPEPEWEGSGALIRFAEVVVLAPLMETALLLWLVREEGASRLPGWATVSIVAGLFTALHALVKPIPAFLPTIFVLFALFAFYLRRRSASASWRTCYIEGTVMHGVHNALSVLPALWVDL